MINLLAKWPANIHYAQLLANRHDNFIIIRCDSYRSVKFQSFAGMHLVIVVHVNVIDTMYKFHH